MDCGRHGYQERCDSEGQGTLQERLAEALRPLHNYFPSVLQIIMSQVLQPTNHEMSTKADELTRRLSTNAFMYFSKVRDKVESC